MNIIKGTVKDKTGIYIAVKYSNNTEQALLNIQNKYKVPNPNTDFHTTLIYSEVGDIPIPKDYDLADNAGLVDVSSEIWDTDDGRTLVLVFKHDYLEEHHNKLMEKYGYEYDYDEYKPHITLSYDVGNFNTEINEQIPIEIISGYYNPLERDWVSINSFKTGIPSPDKGKSIKKRVQETKSDPIQKKMPKIG